MSERQPWDMTPGGPGQIREGDEVTIHWDGGKGTSPAQTTGTAYMKDGEVMVAGHKARLFGKPSGDGLYAHMRLVKVQRPYQLRIGSVALVRHPHFDGMERSGTFECTALLCDPEDPSWELSCGAASDGGDFSSYEGLIEKYGNGHTVYAGAMAGDRHEIDEDGFVAPEGICCAEHEYGPKE